MLLIFIVQYVDQLGIYECCQMVSCLHKGTFTGITEEITGGYGAAVAGVGVFVPFVYLTPVIGLEPNIAAIGTRVYKTQDEATVLGIVSHNLVGALTPGSAIASTSGTTFAVWLIAIGTMSPTAVIDVNVRAKNLLIDGGTDGLTAPAGVSILKLYAVYYLRPGLQYDLAYEFLQGLLGLGVGG